MRYGLGLSACLVIAIAASPVRADFVSPPEAPVERLVRNTESYIQEKPDDPQGYYTLARLHLMAFCLQSDHVPVYERTGEKLPQPSDLPWGEAGAKGRIDANKAIQHITASIANYRKALAKRPGDGLYELGLACAMEAAAPVSCFIGSAPGEATPQKVDPAVAAQISAVAFPESVRPAEAARTLRANLKAAMPALAVELTRTPRASYYITVAGLLAEAYRHEAADAYYRAFKAKSGEDTKQKYRPIAGLMSHISYEAGQGFLRIAESDPCAERWEDRIDEVNKVLRKIQKQPMGPVTPIIFSMQARHATPRTIVPMVRL